MNYQEWKKTYTYAVKHWPDVSSMFGNEERINIVIHNTKQEKRGSRWITTEEYPENARLENYMNIIESVPFFRNIGGKERVSVNYTRWGKMPTDIISTSPDGSLRHIREFKF